ncbi:MAG TPA: hypothetical protein VHW23_42455 [Kofleriaceae bacterium]|jgi:hypothetical protein|nr:hypothetical protein [Kofleriaceae bacterium]
MTGPRFLHVHARLRVQQRQPGIPDRELVLEIWLAGSRFRVRDPAGRAVAEIVGDVTAPRGLGLPVRELEEMMDRASATLDGPPTELTGDLATGEGWVQGPFGDRWRQPAAELAPAALQILAGDKAAGLTATGTEVRLGRRGLVYHGTVAVRADDLVRYNRIHRVIAPPYLVFETAHDTQVEALSYLRELIALEEGTVTEADLAPAR